MRPERDLVSLGANGPSRDYATVGPGLLTYFLRMLASSDTPVTSSLATS